VLQFNKLRLTGFKSFVDSTELLISPGLTGVVGPNGCGKSNLVEALRWVMGETSAKQMRGSGMDDVIFGGTANRPARNIAEVILSLDNTARTAPAQFNEFEDLDVTRRIEREKGSAYRVNGKDVRARDVQLLFADSATGARSTALVSQGRIGAVIAAKPTERRTLLEEAAGITGLHSRRHEAELRLRGAETNLERLDDILITLDTQLLNLKKQSRQATRYRNISGHIRRTEAMLFHLRWLAAQLNLAEGRTELQSTQDAVRELTGLTANATTVQAERASGLPELRQAEAATAAELQRLVIAREGLEEEEARIESARSDNTTRLEQIAADRAREETLVSDAKAAVERLEGERSEIEKSREGEDSTREAAAKAAEEVSTEVNARDDALTQITQQIAHDEARRASLTRTVNEAEQRVDRLATRAAEANEQHAALEAESVDWKALEAAEETLTETQTALEQARQDVEKAESGRSSLSDSERETVKTLHEAQSVLNRLEAEEKALTDILDAGGQDLWPPLIDAVSVEPGYEAALGAALGDDLTAPTDESAPIRWRTLSPFSGAPSLPGSAKPLSDYVKGPAALNRRLDQIGIVDDEDTARALSKDLTQGQRLVCKTGSLWRWDGYTVSAGAVTAAAARLEQGNRLKDVRARLEGVRETVTQADSRVEAAREAVRQGGEAERTARATAQETDRAFTTARDALAKIKELASTHSTKLQAVQQTQANIEADQRETKTLLSQSKDELAELPDGSTLRDQSAEIRAELAEKRARQVECRSTLENLIRAANVREDRLREITNELGSWNTRQTNATQQMEQLQERRQLVSTEIERLAALPQEIAERRRALLDQIQGSEGKRTEAADALAIAEKALAVAEKNLRESEAKLAQARERQIRAEGIVEQANQACTGIIDRMRDQLDCGPDDLPEIAELKEGAELPELEGVERRLDRLLRERDTMGPVNLRAEQEMQEMTEQIETLNLERGDLIEAIEKLRRGIAELNREGRQRLLASFKEVDQHFQDLFVRMFGGGTAHLKLTDSDDPLEAGLEIMASPPGKKLQSLSLLSGGEQALTALSLLFGVFLTNPAPICVLDEVDAPLDDANVDRFCSLLAEMAATGETRFVVITHHRMTMARMDRLFGVTMSERGVSQLVSVDLQGAAGLRATG
jgi:chromosome segregation protein